MNTKHFRLGVAGVLITLLALMLTWQGWSRTLGLQQPEQQSADPDQIARDMPVPGGPPGSETAELSQLELDWANRVTYPTGKFNPEWVRQAAAQDAKIQRHVPAGRPNPKLQRANSPLNLNPSGFTALGPAPERMTGCNGCYDYTMTAGRTNAIAIDPVVTSTVYIAPVGGGVWKTTNCCFTTTVWISTMDDPSVSTTSIDTLAIDPNDHNTIYAGTGDLNYGSYSMGSQGIMKSTNGGDTWTVLGASVFGAMLPEPAGQFPQYQAVGKVRVDPRNSNNVLAGTKTGLYLSYDGGNNWTGPCLTNNYTTMRQDLTGLELTDTGSSTRIIAAVGVRGYATPVQYNLDQNGANGLYVGSVPASGCPTDFTSIASNANGFVFGTQVSGQPYTTGANMNASTGVPYGGTSTGDQLGRIDIAIAPSNPNVIYAQVQSIVANSASGCGGAQGCQLGAWASTDGGATWAFMAGSQGGSLRSCANSGAGSSSSAGSGDYAQNWYDQGVAVDPNNPDRVFFDTFEIWLATRTGTTWYDVSCGYTGVSPKPVHVDQHGLAFMPGSSSFLLASHDGGINATKNADAAALNTLRPTWINMDNTLNTIEFYSGDISGNFATSASPQAAGGAQDNGPSTALFTAGAVGPTQWQMGTGGDGFYARIDPVGTGSSLRFWLGNNSGGLSRCIGVNSSGVSMPCTNGGATWTSKRGSWTSDTQAFMLPFDIFHGGIPGGDDCPAAATNGGCGHLVAGTTRVWETITGNAANTNGTVGWYVTNNPTTGNLTKQSLGNRSFINQVKYSPKKQSIAIAGTNDGNVQIGFNLGTGVAAQGNWVNVTGNNVVLPNRPILGIAMDPTTTNAPIGYAAVGGFNENTPTTPGHVYQVTCTTTCASFTWADKTGNLPNIPVDSIAVNPNVPQQVFAGTDFGLYYTDDIRVSTPKWYRFTNGLPTVMIWDMQVDRGATALSLWTRGRGAYAWPLPLAPLAFQPTTINGQVYNDLNGNGTQDASEGGMSAWTVQLINPATSAILATTKTDASGNYSFPVTSYGSYELRESPKPGYLQTTPNPANVIPYADGTPYTGVNFGVVKPVDLQVSVVQSTGTQYAGYPMTYTINAFNNGPAAAQNMTLTDVVPANTTFGSVIAPAGWSCNAPAAGATGTVSCTTPSMLQGKTAFTMTVDVNADTPNSSKIADTATVSSDVFDTKPANNTYTVSRLIFNQSDVSIQQVGDSLGGGVVRYSFTIQNAGPDAAKSVTLTDALAATTVAASFTASQGTCTLGQKVTCSLGDVAMGSTVTVVITANVTGQPASITNTGKLTTATVDPHPADKSATAVVTGPF